MSLVRTSIWNGAAVVIRLGVGLVLNKILAIFVGPAGYAAIGQFQNFVQIASTASNGAISTGVTKFTAERANSPDQQHALWSTAAGLVIPISIGLALLIGVFSAPLSTYFLKSPDFADVFIWFAGGLVFMSLNAVLLAVLNGRKELRGYVTSNIAGSFVILLTMSVLSFGWHVRGALIAVAINQAIVLSVTLAICWRKEWFRLAYFRGRIDWSLARNLMIFAIMASVSAVANSVGQLLVRNHLGATFGWAAAGYWDATVRLSSLNWIVINTSMAFYFLPRLTELALWSDVRREIVAGARIIMPYFIVASVIIYLLRIPIIDLLFTRQFRPMSALFGWQLLGDVFRVASWFFAYTMIAKVMVWRYILAETAVNVAVVLATIALTPFAGLRGAAIAYALTYIVALPVMYMMLVKDAVWQRDIPSTRQTARTK